MIWSAKFINHRKEDRIGVEFEKDKEIIQQIKLIHGARWSQQKKLWHIPDTPENRERFKIIQKKDTILSAEGQEHLTQFIRWLSSKRYSPNTIKTYSDALRSFLVYNQECTPHTTVPFDKLRVNQAGLVYGGSQTIFPIALYTN